MKYLCLHTNIHILIALPNYQNIDCIESINHVISIRTILKYISMAKMSNDEIVIAKLKGINIIDISDIDYTIMRNDRQETTLYTSDFIFGILFKKIICAG